MSDIVLDALCIFSFIPQNYISFFKYEKKIHFDSKTLALKIIKLNRWQEYTELYKKDLHGNR